MEIPMIIEDIESQSNVAEKTNSPKNRAKILPRYLRASPGSCHDFCKYGKKEATERIPIQTFLKQKRAGKAFINPDIRLGKALKKKQNRVENVEPELDVPEKTLYVIESTIESVNPKPTQDYTRNTVQNTVHNTVQLSQSPPKRGVRRVKHEPHSKKPESSDSKESGVPKKKKIVNHEKLELKNNGIRRGAKPGSEARTGPAQKLNFRRGTTLDPKTEANTARRLKFRRAKLIAEDKNEKGDTQRPKPARLVARSRSATSVESARRVLKRSEVVAERVVLRHQNVARKREGRRLLNNVIEETASRLVVARKSKVKALVGAFETVISLQEARPSIMRPFNL